MDWLLTILGIVALIVLHELGHFAAAKAVGMRVERFSLFFPPTIVKARRGETEYGIGAIPAGGYVKITGMNPEELRDLDLRVAMRAYFMKAPWRRIVVILAGPGVNIVIAFVLFWVVLFSGSLGGDIVLGNLDEGLRTARPAATVAELEKGMPAHGVLRDGDKLLRVDGKHATVASTMRAIESHRCAGKLTDGCLAQTPVRITLRRDGKAVAIAVRPRYDAEAKRMLLGFAFGARPLHFGAAAAASGSAHAMWHATVGTVTGLGRALTSSKERKNVSSLIGITQITEQAVASGAGRALVVIGYISLVLGVLNLMPFLPLDGGHVLWSVAEKLRGRRVSLTAMWRFSSVGLLLLAFLVISGVSNDIGRLAG